MGKYKEEVTEGNEGYIMIILSCTCQQIFQRKHF